MTDPRSKEFWDERYLAGETPWDYRGVQPEFEHYLREQPPPLRILIPGCGTSHDLRAALDLGHDPIGLDLSSAAVALARSQLADSEAWRVAEDDFFTAPLAPGSFDLIFERTFLCAIPPDLRPDYARRVSTLLKPTGRLVGFFIYGDEPDPPPYPLARDEDQTLLAPLFEQIDSQPSSAPLPFFEGMEQWQVWQKRPSQ
jgi:thiopurine S-methyltransferase